MELISAHDKLPDVIWTRYFVEDQGYAINEYMIFQDNMSSLSLEKNGRVLSLKRTKHIKAKYFLIKDCYNSVEIDLRYCPTDVMWADILISLCKGKNLGTCVHSSRTVHGTTMMTLSFELTNWQGDQ
jgi:hypothetical protein